MDGNYFKSVDEILKFSITNGIDLNDNGKFTAMMKAISFHSCTLLGMRYAANKDQPFNEERNKYFDTVQSILKILYCEYVLRLSPKEVLEMCENISSKYQTLEERNEVIRKVRSLIPNLKISWLRCGLANY